MPKKLNDVKLPCYSTNNTKRKCLTAFPFKTIVYHFRKKVI
nr:MAG TPA: hypothetical protein [Caudoviricetes sp.]